MATSDPMAAYLDQLLRHGEEQARRKVEVRASARQLRYLRHLGFDGSKSDLTASEASRLIARLQRERSRLKVPWESSAELGRV